MLRIEQLTATRPADRWRVGWRITNPDDQPVSIMSAWLPHSGFRSDEWQVDPPLAVEPGVSVALESDVSCPSVPGTVVENAFLILRLQDRRIFARLRVTIQADGAPAAIVESVTDHGSSQQILDSRQ